MPSAPAREAPQLLWSREPAHKGCRMTGACCPAASKVNLQQPHLPLPLSRPQNPGLYRLRLEGAPESWSLSLGPQGHEAGGLAPPAH